MCYHILVFTVLKEQRMSSSQQIRKGPKCRCFTFIKGQLRQLFTFRIRIPKQIVCCVCEPLCGHGIKVEL